MVKVQTIGIAIVVLIAVATLAWLARRRYVAKQEANENTGTDRVAQSQERRQTGVRTRSKVARMPTPAKVLLGSALLLALLVTYNIYKYLKTGSPMQAVYAHETQLVVASLLSAVGGMRLQNSLGVKYNTAYVIHEPSPDNDIDEEFVEEIRFDADDVDNSDEGTIIHEYKDRKILGLFRRPKLVGEDRRLRNDSELYRPLADKVEHGVPSHAIPLPNGDYVWRTTEKTVNSSPKVPVDYEYKPPFLLNSDQYQQLRSEKARMEVELREQRQLLARLQQTVENLEQENENKSGDSLDKALSLIERVQDVVADGKTEFRYQEVDAPSHNGQYGTRSQEPPSQHMDSEADA